MTHRHGTPGLRYTIADGVAQLTLSRPDKSNALDLPAAESLAAAVASARSDDAVRVVLLAGDGRRFCAGGDIASMTAAEDRSRHLEQMAATLDGALQGLAEMDKPVVAAVQGAAAGAGLAMVLSADVAIGTRSSKYLAAYASVGLTPDCGLSWLLPRAVGQQRALELALTGRVLSADEACDWGLITTVVDDDELAARASSTASRLAKAPPYAVGQARRLIRSAWTATRKESGADEVQTISRAVATAEARELADLFLQRQP